jgi:hypothetical protein
MSRAKLVCRIFFISVVLFALAGCADHLVDSRIDNRYIYWAYDEDGILVARGEISFDFDKAPALSGAWDIAAEAADDPVPHDGEGRLVGTFDDSTLSCNLHPEYADNNILLSGRIGSNAISGEWQWVTFAGPTSAGTFVATRKWRID